MGGTKLLELRQIVKDYKTGDSFVRALDGITLKFRRHEFVSILGPSGCGKTTLLNIIGGLDQYTSGDLIINGTSTKEYRDADWDTYRNHSIGFVFQSYNLIPHQTVLANVELALTLSGISKKERRERAAKALSDVGLGDQLNKKPNQLSGGQMQRVAIARALVNDPDILLADEPTGALDTQTSVQIMDILREISHKKLIIMVTYNPDLAYEYSNRIISVVDGHIVDDSNPYFGEAAAEPAPAETAEITPIAVAPKKVAKKKKKSMSFFTALSLSLNNLLTKKGRTFMTSFAGSIGIIGIALILSVSTGVNNYINAVQRDTLAGYPLELHAETMDFAAVMTTLMEKQEESTKHDKDKVYESTILADLVNAMGSAGSTKNDLASFKKYLEKTDKFDEYLTAVQYAYNFNWSVLVKDKDGNVVKSDLFGWMSDAMLNGSSFGDMSAMGSMMGGGMNVWTEMLEPLDKNSDSLVNDVLKEQYELVDEGSRWPTAPNEVVLVVSENNELSDLSLYALGLRTKDEMLQLWNAAVNGEQVSTDRETWTFDEIRDMEFRLILASDAYAPSGNGYVNLTETADGRLSLYDDEDAITIKVVGIVRPKEGSTATTLTAGSIGYTAALSDLVLERTQSSDLINLQKANPTIDILTGKYFATGEVSPERKREVVMEYLATLPEEEAQMFLMTVLITPEAVTQASAQLSQMSDAELKPMVEQMMELAPSMGVEIPDGFTPELVLSSPELKAYFITAAATFTVQQQISEQLFVQGGMTALQVAATLDDTQMATLYEQDGVPRVFSDSSYETNLYLLGDVDEANPVSIYLYASTFENKDELARLIKEYNDSVDEDKKIEYTDYVGLLMSSITTVLNAITYVLIAFVAISLVVSSIMIGIITYISVLERTKEIGILRSIGASKRDVSRVFNAETLIVGFVAGMIGILVTLFFNIIINIILFSLTGIVNLKATLPVVGAIVLVAISMILTFIAGLFPSRFAAKRNPVEALRSE